MAGGSAGLHAWSSAHVISLRTAQPRGYASNGRCYYPGIGLPVLATTGRVAPADVVNRVTAFKTFLEAVNAATNTYAVGAKVCVMSKGGMKNSFTPKTEYVTAIRADDRMDSIERRENDTPSTWQTLTIA